MTRFHRLLLFLALATFVYSVYRWSEENEPVLVKPQPAPAPSPVVPAPQPLPPLVPDIDPCPD